MYSLRDPRFRDDLPAEAEPEPMPRAMFGAIFILIVGGLGLLGGVVFGIGVALRDVVPVHGARPPAAVTAR